MRSTDKTLETLRLQKRLILRLEENLALAKNIIKMNDDIIKTKDDIINSQERTINVLERFHKEISNA